MTSHNNYYIRQASLFTMNGLPDPRLIGSSESGNEYLDVRNRYGEPYRPWQFPHLFQVLYNGFRQKKENYQGR